MLMTCIHNDKINILYLVAHILGLLLSTVTVFLRLFFLKAVMEPSRAPRALSPPPLAATGAGGGGAGVEGGGGGGGDAEERENENCFNLFSHDQKLI